MKNVCLLYLITISTNLLSFVEEPVPEKLYQVKKGGDWYLLVIGDTVYHEKRQPDKISYFTDLDTLIRDKVSGYFVSKNNRLVLTDTIATLTKLDSKKKAKNLLFLPANEKQIQIYNGYKNADKYVAVGGIVYKMLWPRQNNPTYARQMENDWRALSQQIKKLDQNEFDSAMNNFKTIYLIK